MLVKQIKPITPSEIPAAQGKLVPPVYIRAINDCIVSKWDGKCATFTRNDIRAKSLFDPKIEVTIEQIRGAFCEFRIVYGNDTFSFFNK